MRVCFDMRAMQNKDSGPISFLFFPWSLQLPRLNVRAFRSLTRSLKVFDLMSPLHQLGRARWSLLNGMDKVAEKALDLGLAISEEASSVDCSATVV